MQRDNNSKIHWENIFVNKDTTTVSWYQERPKESIDLIIKHTDSKSNPIIDIGGGDSRLPDNLIDLGYTDLTILDISEFALNASKTRLEGAASKAKWINSNILDYTAIVQYDLWHDRAVFHFLSDENDQLKYKEKLLENLSDKGIAIIGGFSKNNGPKKCSGLEIQQHDRESISNIFLPDFKIIEDFESTHMTPSGSEQNFYWVILMKNIPTD